MSLPLKYLGLIESGTPAENLYTRGCLSPVKIYVYNSFTAKNEPMYVDCGHCVRCKDQRRNEWASRMILHAKSKPWAYRYFITLTYGSYNLNIYNKHPFLKDWLQTYPVCDEFNSRHKPAWTPSILIPDHFTKFMKRLRFKLPENKISYCACGELGGTFGRPHFHAILYSDKPITRSDVLSAWSLDCYVRKKGEVSRYCGKLCPLDRRFTFHIGRVDFNDLTANGTCDFDSTKNPTEIGKTAAKNCFQYVAKYCVKDSDYMNKYAKKRYFDVYQKLENDIEYIENHFTYSPVIVPNGDKQKVIWTTSLLSDEDYEIINNSVNDWINQNPIFNYLPQFLIDYILNKYFIHKKIKKNGKLYEKITFNQFCKLFGTYFTTSRMYAIGKNYFLENVGQFEKENYALRKVQGKTLTFPSYFYRLLENRQFGVRFRSRTTTGVSLNKGCLALVFQYFSNLRENRSYSIVSPHHFLAATAPTLKRPKNLTKDFASGLINPYSPLKGSLLDITLTCSDNKCINYIYSSDLDEFIGLKYDRKCKNYFPIDYISRIDMCDIVLSAICKFGEKYDKLEKSKSDKLKLYDMILEVPNEILETAASNFISQRNFQSRLYETEHFNFDNQ